VHLAALVGYPACLREPGLARLTNVAATQTLIDVRQPGQKLVFASTGSIYGKMPDAICTEETEPSPVSLYGETKAESERIVLKAGDSVSLRFATAYGVSPCMRDDLLINNFTREAVHNRALVVYESHARRTFVHVRDMASSMIFALDAWDSVRDNVFNVGDQALSLTKGEICQRLMSYVDYHVEFADIAEDLDCRDYTVSFEAFRRKGYQTEVDFDDAIRELVMAYRLRAHA
jgi:nucleoside-diphosphate-sugar epimerase